MKFDRRIDTSDRRLGPIRRRGPFWYRWSVLYRETSGGRIHQEIVESTDHESAINAVRVIHPGAIDLAATKVSGLPILEGAKTLRHEK